MGWYQWHWNHKRIMLERSPTLRKVIWWDWLQWRWLSFECKVLKGVFKMTYLFSIWSYNSFHILSKTFIFWVQTFQDGCFEFNNLSPFQSHDLFHSSLNKSSSFEWKFFKGVVLNSISLFLIQNHDLFHKSSNENFQSIILKLKNW